MTLEELIARRQDELRGRKETRWDRFKERFEYVDWIDVAGMICWIVALSCFAFVVIVKAIYS